LILVPTPWRITVTPPAVTAELTQFAQTLKLIQFKQIFKWSFNPPFEARRLRRAAIIALIAGPLTLIAAVVIASIDPQDPFSQGSSPQNAPVQNFGPQNLAPQKGLPGKVAPPNSFNTK
jgi:hypothetical protein